MINRNLVSRLNKASLELLNNSNERICDDTGIKNISIKIRSVK